METHYTWNKISNSDRDYLFNKFYPEIKEWGCSQITVKGEVYAVKEAIKKVVDLTIY